MPFTWHSHTELKDVFAIRMLEEFDAKGNQVQERYNGSGATVYGLNLDGKAVFSSAFMTQAGIKYQKILRIIDRNILR